MENTSPKVLMQEDEQGMFSEEGHSGWCKGRKEERRREGVRGAVWAPGSKSGFLNKQRHRVMMASQQGAWAEPCYSCRFIHPQVLIGRILVEQVLGLGRGRKP